MLSYQYDLIYSAIQKYPIPVYKINSLIKSFENLKSQLHSIKDLEKACNKCLKALYILNEDYNRETENSAYYLIVDFLQSLEKAIENPSILSEKALNKRNLRYDKKVIVKAFEETGTVKKAFELLHSQGIEISDKQLRNIIKSEGVYQKKSI